MKKIKSDGFAFSALAAALCLVVFGACFTPELEDIPEEENGITTGSTPFDAPPRLTLSKSGDEKTVTASWSASEPKPDVYDIYYIKENASNAETVRTGTRVANVKSGAKIIFTMPGTYSFIVRAIKSGYQSVNSAVKTTTLAFEVPPAQSKRGVSYNFTDQAGGASSAGAVMDLLESVTWFYNWGTQPDGDVAAAAAARDVAYFPMSWNASGDVPNRIRAYKASHPECDFILGYNEPNLTDQANMTPSQAAAQWPTLVDLANELDMKLVSPAMNYGTLSGYSDPIKWLDEFFAKPGVSLEDVSAIAIHCYMPYPGAVKGFIDKFKKYGKPIWMTEFCGWEQSGYAVIHNAEDQMRYMSEVVTYMDLDPAVERYAWFIPLYGNNGTEFPYMQLLTKTNPPQLTDLGKAYAKMGCCDKTVYTPAGQKIEAERFSDCNVSEWVSLDWSSNDTYNGGDQYHFYQGSVHFRPTTDSADDTGGLDIYEFNNSKTSQWVEYQVQTPEAKAYTLSLRYQASSAASLKIAVDGGSELTQALNASSWATQQVSLGSLAAGQHKLRLKIASGSLALNWLKVE
ncbi:MAG: DUF5010 C-terminal domain-containing protein [Treponema sp.]|jgi:hypothetical protein|nr:DUF5010 C-terminal domain-containing protein [Treponema sp.]